MDDPPLHRKPDGFAGEQEQRDEKWPGEELLSVGCWKLETLLNWDTKEGSGPTKMDQAVTCCWLLMTQVSWVPDV